MHDDRAYTLAMLGWYLMEKRMEHVKTRKKTSSSDIISKLQVTQGKPINKLFG